MRRGLGGPDLTLTCDGTGGIGTNKSTELRLRASGEIVFDMSAILLLVA